MRKGPLEDDLQYIAKYPLQYEQLKETTVLVTGATGLIGASIVRALIAVEGIHIIALVRNIEKANKLYSRHELDNIELIVGDITFPINVNKKVDWIFHCAAVTTSKLMIEKPVETLSTAIEGTKNILELARKNKCKSMVYISSMEMYGTFNNSDTEITEDKIGYINPLKVRSNYPESKRLCENMCVVSVVTSLGTVLLPRASYYIQRGELKEFHRITRKALNFVFLMATPLFVYFIYFAKEGIFFLSGNNYVGSIIPMQVIMPTLLLIGITNILGIQILVPTGREKIVLYSEIVGAVVDVIINALLIPVYASTGAAIGTLVAEFAVFVVQFYALKDEILNTFRQIHYIKILIALSVGSIVSLWVKILNLECFFSLVISSLLFFGAYGFVLLILKEELFVEIFNTIKNKII